MLSPETMIANVIKLDCWGRTVWRLMATRAGAVCGLGHQIDFDTQDEAERTLSTEEWAIIGRTA